MFRDNSFAGYPIISQHFCDIDGRLKPFVDLLYSSFSEGEIFICQSLNDIDARECKFAGVSLLELSDTLVVSFCHQVFSVQICIFDGSFCMGPRKKSVDAKPARKYNFYVNLRLFNYLGETIAFEVLKFSQSSHALFQ